MSNVFNISIALNDEIFCDLKLCQISRILTKLPLAQTK